MKILKIKQLPLSFFLLAIGIELDVVHTTRANSIVYGGILNTTRAVKCIDNDEIDHVLKFAVSQALKYWPQTVIQDEKGEIQPYNAYGCSVMEVIYTRDGKTEAVVRLEHPYEFDQVIETELRWGYTYKLKISWPEENIKPKYVHRFTVTEYIDDELYLFEHTFYKEEKAVLKESPLTIQCSSTPSLSLVSENPAETSVTPSHVYLSNIFNIPLKLTDQCPLQQHTNCFPPDMNNIVRINLDSSINLASEDNSYSRTFVSGRSVLHNASVDFTILSFNIWNTNTVREDRSNAKLYKERIKHIIKLCEQTDADVIAFQEVRFEEGKGGSYGPNQVRHLSGLLKKYQYIYQPAQIQEHGLPRRIEEGVAIFSKHPIISHDYLLLSRNKKDKADGHQRILLHAEIEIPHFGPIHVFNTHMSLSHVARQRNVVEIWNQLQKYTQAPVFLMGDFNAEAHNDEVKFLSGLVQLHGLKTTGLNDIWMLKHGPDNKGFTFSTLDDELTKRIDLIFMKSHELIQLEDVLLLDDGLRRQHAASDHVGLLAKFKGLVDGKT